MSFSLWLLVLGCILLTLGLASAYLRLLPVSTSFIYLLFGLAIGPAGLHAWRSGLADISGWFEHLSEAALLISLFIGGLKLRLPLRSPAWTAAWLLAGPVLLGCILGLTLGAHFLFGLDWGLALLVAAILAPTDPVLASDIQVNHAGDDDRLRYAVSGEAGLNDGIAFPFVIAALLLIGQGGGLPGEFDRSGLDWLLRDVLWAIPLGLLVGYCLGHGLGRLAIHLRARHTDTSVSANDFLALALIALSYVGADALGGWGFLASFAAGIGLRHAEVATLGRASAPAEAQAAAADVREAGQASGAIEYGADRSEHPKVAAGAVMLDVLSFGNLLERSLEVLLVTLLGAMLYQHWDWRALPLALLLFCVCRPAMVWLLVGRRLMHPAQRRLLGWFGIRGIGSLYYLSYALNQGLPTALAHTASDLVLSLVALSICVHGLSIQPLLMRHARSVSRRDRNDRDLAVLLEDGEADLLHAFQALGLAGGQENVFLAQAGLGQACVQWPAVLDDERRRALDQGVELRMAQLEQGQTDVDDDQGDDHQYRVDQREVVAQQRLLGGFADDHQQQQVEGGDVGQ